MATPKMNSHFLEFSRFLNSNEVRYLLIGGHAVGYHGWARNTKHIDFWIAGDTANQARTVDAIRQFAFPHAGDDLFDQTNAVVRFGVPPLRIEVLRTISGITFDEAWPNRVYWVCDGTPIPVIGLAELRRNKAASGRTQDLADLEHLPPCG